MRIIKTELAEDVKLSFREELKSSMPEDTHDEIDLGYCDYLISCIHVDPEDVYKAIEDTERRK